MLDETAIAALLPDLIALRRDIHAHPELAYAEHRTAALVATALEELGLEVTRGVGGTGVVGVLRRGTSPRSIGLRADMDALPIQEEGGPAHASRHDGIFHGCGHDGHTAMLLGAARYLARDARFEGTVNFIFQPAEEGEGGARAMVRDGLFERFPCDRVFALHNWPDLPAGSLRTRPGPIMASADKFRITLQGRGGHAALAHQTPDVLLAAAQLVQQLNTIVSRRVAATQAAVLSVTRISGGHAHNVLPASCEIVGTVRTFDAAVQDRIEASLRAMCQGAAQASETRIEVEYDRYYPATINDEAAALAALEAARRVSDDVALAPDPAFTSEDFAFMLQERPGAYLWLGQRSEEHQAPLHHPHYDFNDRIMATGIGVFVALVETHLAPQ
ncbi:M20 family metallopeptidase [Novosphingobium sp. 1949]|uniref:M20 family metallopeptidase n=1 Tax=Novosphingobium organovorum TaxID=2930092 RepID=A0ABT0BCZ9_9SPHN|nr:M20 aminoacylase family protein [Novosphingobium organovorum]MCJ2182952.1 M20 family metallopeptidase [Novosphingobium organovorum]